MRNPTLLHFEIDKVFKMLHIFNKFSIGMVLPMLMGGFAADDKHGLRKPITGDSRIFHS